MSVVWRLKARGSSELQISFCGALESGVRV